jgi:hypothetical protein
LIPTTIILATNMATTVGLGGIGGRQRREESNGKLHHLG